MFPAKTLGRICQPGVLLFPGVDSASTRRNDKVPHLVARERDFVFAEFQKEKRPRANLRAFGEGVLDQSVSSGQRGRTLKPVWRRSASRSSGVIAS